ncbi:ras guanine nucleotide exchange factor domain-containing protein [Chlamydoabsidia padenii]|nr:ras guanine nucleotide exchange factor domain-containing protein [Chlamydoabsidia padenii]
MQVCIKTTENKEIRSRGRKGDGLPTTFYLLLLLDNQTIPIFIIFYRKFMTPYKLASALIKRILSIFTTWLTNYWGDFYHQQTREQLELFIGRLSNTVQLTKSPTMQHIIVKLQSLLMQPTPTEDPDDNWGQKDGHDDDLWDTGNHNKKKDSGYLSTYSGTSPDSPTGDSSTSISTSPSTTLPQFAGGIICMDNNNNPVRRTKVTPGPIQPNANPSLHKSKSNDSLASVKLNTTLLLVLSSQEIAEQLTCIEVELFGKIKAKFVRMIWGSNDNKQQPNHSSSSPTTKSGLMASISHFNFISAWVISMIVTQTKLGKRVALLEKFMMVAVALRHLNNYNTLMAILAGINNAAILRLKQTQEGIKKKKIYKQYQSLEKLMSSERSHCSYRMALKASTKCPCIPYLGIHSQDLIALTEANKDMKMDGTIHWDKFRLMGKSIMSITKLQHHQNGYALTPDLTILTWIAQSRILTDEEQYSQSMRIEPRLKTSSMTRLRDLCFKK